MGMRRSGCEQEQWVSNRSSSIHTPTASCSGAPSNGGAPISYPTLLHIAFRLIAAFFAASSAFFRVCIWLFDIRDRNGMPSNFGAVDIRDRVRCKRTVGSCHGRLLFHSDAGNAHPILTLP